MNGTISREGDDRQKQDRFASILSGQLEIETAPLLVAEADDRPQMRNSNFSIAKKVEHFRCFIGMAGLRFVTSNLKSNL
jgi:hypothetical protein